MTVVLLLLVSVLPAPGPIEDYVDRIELNQQHDRNGQETFAQLIFWGGGYVREWKLADGVVLDRARGGWSASWHDGRAWRCVWAPRLTRSWTQHDPELRDRLRLSRRDRWGLTPIDPVRK